MDRTLISFNVPNLITIWLMAFLGFVIIGLIAQGLSRMTGGNALSANNEGGY